MIIWSNAEFWWIINKPRRKDIILVDFEVHCVGAPSAEPIRNLRRPWGPRDAQKRSRNCTRHLFKLSTSPPQIGLHVWGIYFAYLVVWNTIRITSNYCPPDRQYDFECCSNNKLIQLWILQSIRIENTKSIVIDILLETPKHNIHSNIQVIWIITSKCVRYCFVNRRFL